MKAVILDGARQAGGPTQVAHEAVAGELAGMGWEVEPFILRDMEISHCLGCFGCWVQNPGVCIIDDVARDVTKTIFQSDLVVYLSPVTFGGYSSELKKALDRSIGLILPHFMKIRGEVHHKPRYDRYPRLMGVGVLAEADEEGEQMFTTLIERNAINMHSAAYAGGCVQSHQSAEEMREKIASLLAAVGVER